MRVGAARRWRWRLVVAALGSAVDGHPHRGALRAWSSAGCSSSFGVPSGWRKAILRAGGLKALHDEEAIYDRQLAAARAAGSDQRAGLDWYSFTVAFKGVFLEGLEVAFIVVTLGSNQHNVGLAALSAGAALVVVLFVGVLVHAPLSRVPENTMKFVVGTMLTTFGIFWGSEGAGVTWPGSDAAIGGILVFVLCRLPHPGRLRLVAGCGGAAPTTGGAPDRRRSSV